MIPDVAIIPFILCILILVYIARRLKVKVLAQYQSKELGLVEVFSKYNKEKVLTLNKYPLGISINNKDIKYSYWYYIAQTVITFCNHKDHPSILVLGLGAGTVCNLVYKLDPQISQTAIEIESLIIKAFNEFFRENTFTNIQIIQADAYKYIKQPNKILTKYDAVIVDITIGELNIMPKRSNTVEFIKDVKLLLKKDGIIIINRDAHNLALIEDTKSFKELIRNLFSNVSIQFIQDPRGYQNDIITAIK